MIKAETKGILTTVFIAVIFFMLLGVVSLFARIVFADHIKEYQLEAYCWTNAAAQLVLSIAIILVMRKTNVFNKQDFAVTTIGKGLWAGLVGVFYALFMFTINFFGNFSHVHPPDLSYLLACVFIAFTTGLFEEVLIRGFTYKRFIKNIGYSVDGVKKSIIWSSVLFGVMHIVNLSGYDLSSILTTTSQIISAVILGLFFALVYLQSKSLWSVIILHSLIDGATFVLYSLLSKEAFLPKSSEILTKWQIVLESFIVPLVIIMPFLIAVIVKWQKLKITLSGNEASKIEINPI